MGHLAFLSYAHFDLAKANKLHRDLEARGLDVWIDHKHLLPGMRWRPAIRKAIREAKFFIALVSARSATGEGFRHSELSEALEIFKEFPEDRIYLIPVRLDQCKMPLKELNDLHIANLFPVWAEGVLRVAESLGFNPKRTQSGQGKGRKSRRARPQISQTRYTVELTDIGSGHKTRVVRVARKLNSVQSHFKFVTRSIAPNAKALTQAEGEPHLNLDRVSQRFVAELVSREVDYFVVLTERLLMFSEGTSTYINYLGTGLSQDERVMFTSTAGMAAYAEEAGVSSDVALAFWLTSQLTSYFFELDYHRDLRACPLDFTEVHDDIVPGLQRGEFCASCARSLNSNPKLRDLKKSMIAMLRWGR